MAEENTPKRKRQSQIQNHLKTEANSKYSLANDIKTSPLATKSDANRPARKYIKEHCETGNANKILPGQLILFEYFEPKTKEELEYYDASPCTIFFNVVNTTLGKRVLGFNIHYYPPHIRKQIMNKIFNIYKPIYVKYFTKGIDKEIDAFDYEYLINELEKAKLTFGIRMYIPELIGNIWMIKPNEWNVAVYTEGFFKKRTKQAIYNYWTHFKDGKVHKKPIKQRKK